MKSSFHFLFWKIYIKALLLSQALRIKKAHEAPTSPNERSQKPLDTDLSKNINSIRNASIYAKLSIGVLNSIDGLVDPDLVKKL